MLLLYFKCFGDVCAVLSALCFWFGCLAGESVTTTMTVFRNIHFSEVGVCLSGIDCRLVFRKHWILWCMFAACLELV